MTKFEKEWAQRLQKENENIKKQIIEARRQIMKVEDKFLRVTMPDGSKWDVPVKKIAEHRARYYMKDPELGTFQKSYNEDTIPLFESDPFEIEDWAANNMNWKDVVAFARKVESHRMADSDFQEGWTNGDKDIVDVEASP